MCKSCGKPNSEHSPKEKALVKMVTHKNYSEKSATKDLVKHYSKGKAIEKAKKHLPMEGVSEAVERARRKVYGKDAHLTGKEAIEAEYRHRFKTK